MAFIVKNRNQAGVSSASRQGFSTVDQWIQVTQATNAGAGIALPATTTGQLFRVKGGRVVVKCLLGQVTTVIQTQANNMKVSSKALDAASTAIGSAVDIAANVDVTGLQVGGFYFVEGDGTAGVLANAGGSLIGTNSGYWIAPQGEIYITTSATNTGAMKWDVWYQPLDPGSFIEAAVLTNSLLTAAI